MEVRYYRKIKKLKIMAFYLIVYCMSLIQEGIWEKLQEKSIKIDLVKSEKLNNQIKKYLRWRDKKCKEESQLISQIENFFLTEEKKELQK